LTIWGAKVLIKKSHVTHDQVAKITNASIIDRRFLMTSNKIHRAIPEEKSAKDEDSHEKLKIKKIAVIGDVTLDEFRNVDEKRHTNSVTKRGGAEFVSSMLEHACRDMSVKILKYENVEDERLPKALWMIKSQDDGKVRCVDPLQFRKELNDCEDDQKRGAQVESHEGKNTKFEMLVVQDLPVSYNKRTETDNDEGNNLQTSDNKISEKSDNWVWALKKIREVKDEPGKYNTDFPKAFCPRIFLMIGNSLPDFDQNFWKQLISDEEQGSDKEEGLKNLWSHSLALIYADTLRMDGLTISKRISWERTAQDYLKELYSHPKMKDLGKLSHLVIRFGVSGAIYSYRIGRQRFHRLYFDPKAHQIGTHRDPRADGDVVGNQSIFSTSIMSEIVRYINLDTHDEHHDAHHISWIVGGAIRKAIRRCQKHFDDGFIIKIEPEKRSEKHPNKKSKKLKKVQLLEKIGDFIRNGGFDKNLFMMDTIINCNHDEIANERIPVGSPSWSIVTQSGGYNLLNIATKIVMNGIELTLNTNIENKGRSPIWAPVIKFGPEGKENLIVIDRREIESYMAVHRLLSTTPTSDRSLSIGVFGPPGSGKSFVVKSILESITPSPTIKTFNVAQWTSPNQLIEELNKIAVRLLKNPDEDICLFFDEFDCSLGDKTLGWLKYFLSPMEDWKKTHGTKKCPIFVFAGGTRHNYRDFTREDSSHDKEQQAHFEMAKGPDFVSRLIGHINILGPNPVDDYDEAYVIRRAVFLRSLILNHINKNDADEPLKKWIREEIVRAMLKVTSYKHGMRSIRAILAMSVQMGGRSGKYVSGTLPSLTQLNMHVDGKEFMDMIDEAR